MPLPLAGVAWARPGQVIEFPLKTNNLDFRPFTQQRMLTVSGLV